MAKSYGIDIWYKHRFPRLDNTSLNINEFIMHEKRYEYSFDYMQIKSNNFQFTQDLKNLINSTTYKFNNGDLVPAPKKYRSYFNNSRTKEIIEKLF